MASSSSHSLSGIRDLGVNQRWICWHHHVPISVSSTTFWRVCYLWEPWDWILSTVHGCFRYPFVLLTFPSSAHVFCRTCHRVIQSTSPYCTLFDGDSLASHCSQHIGRHSSLRSHGKICHQWCFKRLGAKWFAITALTLCCSEMCVR